MSESKWFDTIVLSKPEECVEAKGAAFPQLAQDSVFQSLRKVLHSSFTRCELFMRLCSKLDKFFAISRASLCLIDKDMKHLDVAHIQVGHDFKSGVKIRLDAEGTLLKEVLEDGRIYIRDFPQALNALEVEKKLLIDHESCSLAIIPLIFGPNKIGTLNLASQSYYAFNILKSHLLDHFFERTAEKLLELP